MFQPVDSLKSTSNSLHNVSFDKAYLEERITRLVLQTNENRNEYLEEELLSIGSSVRLLKMFSVDVFRRRQDTQSFLQRTRLALWGLTALPLCFMTEVLLENMVEGNVASI